MGCEYANIQQWTVGGKDLGSRRRIIHHFLRNPRELDDIAGDARLWINQIGLLLQDTISQSRVKNRKLYHAIAVGISTRCFHVHNREGLLAQLAIVSE
jgi:hypothetical protein